MKMESGWSREQQTLISELIQGMEHAKQLRAQLNGASPVESRDSLVQRILSSYEKALLILNLSVGSMTHPQSQNAGIVSGGIPESPKSINGSPQSDDFNGSFVKENQGCSKKRKTMPIWTDQVRVSSDGLEGPYDDGYSWRKYGQKDILGAKYPRSYYRCTYRSTQNCWATKQVQRSDDDPTVFEVTYRGIHTCSYGSSSVRTSPEKQEKKQNIDNNNNHQQQQAQDALFNFQKGLLVNMENFDNKEMVSPFSFPPTDGCIMSVGCYSPSFMSPATPEPIPYSVSPFQMTNFGRIQKLHHSESDFNENISANNSAANSPIVDLGFSLEPVEFDPNFPFDTPGLFS